MTKLPIPVEALEDAGIVLGRRGAGKSNALMVLFEHELDAGHRSVMIDPKGDRWGVRLNPDKSASRFDVPIFGGDHGDYAVDEDMGERLGALVAEHDLSCLIDLSLLSLQGKQRFMLGFAPVLLQRNRAPLTLFLEEVDQFANQDIRYQPPMLVHHIANFATLGRQRGIVPWVASQRPAKVNATVRSQADTFIGMKVTSPLDREAYREWFKGHGKEAAARVEEEIGRLSPGEALVWAGANEFFDRVQFPMASTYDSGRTPKHGETIDAVTLPKLSNTAIVDMLAKPETEAESVPAPAGQAEHDEIIRLRERVAQLEGLLRGAEAGRDQARDELYAVLEWQTRVRAAVNEIPAEGGGGPEREDGQTEAPQARRAAPVRQRANPQPEPAGERKSSPAGNALPKSQQRVLDAIAWWGALGFSHIERRRACVIAGLSPKASTFGVYISKLAQAGLVDVSNPGNVGLTEAGKVLATVPSNISKVQVVIEARTMLSPAAQGVFDRIVVAYPNWISRDDLADACGLSRTASTLGVYISKAGTLGFVETKPGQVRASDWLFP